MATTTTTSEHPGHRWMLEAFKYAKNALDNKEVPSNDVFVNIRFEFLCLIFFVIDLVGCVIVHKDETIIATGQNEPVSTQNATRHAEICALNTLFAEHDLPTARQVDPLILSSIKH